MIKNAISSVASVFGFGSNEEVSSINNNISENSSLTPAMPSIPMVSASEFPQMPSLNSMPDSISSNSNAQNAFSINQSFTIQGVSDSDFAKNVINAISSHKPSFEKLINEIVNNQRRLSYGS